MSQRLKLPPFARSLSARLLILTIVFVMLAEVLIYVPSIARFRLTYLEEKLVAGQLAALALEATPTGMVDDALKAELLATAGVNAVSLRRDDKHILMLGEMADQSVTDRYDLRTAGAWRLIRNAFETMARQGDALILVKGAPPTGNSDEVEVVLPESPLYAAMADYSARILGLSVVISLITAGLVFLSLHIIFVRPMRRITAGMAAFRNAPEDPATTLPSTERTDEIGTAQRELRRMQEEVRGALRQKTHLANLGTAVTKISHDLRNILATAQLVSDRLAGLKDPQVAPMVPTLMRAIDRAISLAQRSLKYGRADEPEPELSRQPLRPIIEEVRQAVGLSTEDGITFRVSVPAEIEIDADADQLHRAFLNLVRNSLEALEAQGGGEIEVAGEEADGAVRIDVKDTGPGLSDTAKDHLFEPFTSSTRSGGGGLGLNIAREIIRAHGGELALAGTGPEGTVFRITLPAPSVSGG